MTIVGAHHTGFHVADLDRSLAFYRDVLGFETVWERVVDAEYVRQIVGYPSAELHQALLRVPGSEHCLELIDYRGVERVPVDTATANPGTGHICVFVEGLRDLYAQVIEAGGRAVSAPVQVTIGPNEGRLAVYLIDPDGFRVELVSTGPEP